MAKKSKVTIVHRNEEMRDQLISLPDMPEQVRIGKDGTIEVDAELAELLVNNSPSWMYLESVTQETDSEEVDTEEQTDEELADEAAAEEGTENDETAAEDDDQVEDDADGDTETKEAGEFPKAALNTHFSYQELRDMVTEEELEGLEGYNKVKSKAAMLTFLENNWHQVGQATKDSIAAL